MLNTTTFPAADHPYDGVLAPRASVSNRELDDGKANEHHVQDAEPTCSLHYGLARVDETVSNIGHLSDVANITCSVPAATCARVSHQGSSSIFFCNFVRRKHEQVTYPDY